MSFKKSLPRLLEMMNYLSLIILHLNSIIIDKVMKKTILLTTNFYNQPQENEDMNNIITHRLKPKKRDDMEIKSVSNGEKSAISTNQLLSSISTKLHPRSISISSQNRGSTVMAQRAQIMVSCLDKLVVPKFSLGPDQQYTLNYQQLRRKAIRRKIKNIVQPLPCIQKTKKFCGDQNCSLKQRWRSKLVLQSKDSYEAEKLKNYIETLKQQAFYDKQIDKDVVRSFPDKMSPKTKLTLYHASTQKNAMTQALRIVLKMLAACDTQVGYVQGMNLFAAAIVSHAKQVQLSFLFIKQVMKYGNMRKMYVNNFKNMKELCYHLLHRHIKILMNDLYQVFIECGVTIQLFMPFYLSMFACVVDHNFMPSVIDEFMTKGFLFLDKLMLSMLCYLKYQFLECDPAEVTCRLGASHIRSCQIPWDQVINLTQAFQLN